MLESRLIVLLCAYLSIYALSNSSLQYEHWNTCREWFELYVPEAMLDFPGDVEVELLLVEEDGVGETESTSSAQYCKVAVSSGNCSFAEVVRSSGGGNQS
jgi:hypothetical protein